MSDSNARPGDGSSNPAANYAAKRIMMTGSTSTNRSSLTTSRDTRTLPGVWSTNSGGISETRSNLPIISLSRTRAHRVGGPLCVCPPSHAVDTVDPNRE